MKVSQVLYLIGVLVIALAVIFFVLSMVLIPAPEEDSVVNMLGKTTDLDSTLSSAEAFDELKAKERSEKLTFLWIGVLIGTVTILSGIILKRVKEGPDLFVDD
ncbi:hypothetical protein L0Z72_02995, partial [candidate division KSB1 bacterium]|nr:hypothetical protein [candidate division KSB1 bacterium]